MARILRMNHRRIPELSRGKSNPPMSLQVLLVTGFAAEMNLLEIAEALGRRDHGVLARASERNAKLARLRKEIEEQVAAETAKLGADCHLSQKLLLASSIARLFEKIGALSVEVAVLCDQLLRQPRPSRTTEIRKFIEHGAYMADSAASGLVYDELLWAKAAIEQGRAASTLHERINHDLTSLRAADEDASVRLNLLVRLVSKTSAIVGQARQMAGDVIDFLDNAEARV